MKRRFFEEPGFLEAVDNLSSMAELDLAEVELARAEAEEKGIQIKANRWLDPKDEGKTLASVKSTFKVVHNYLKHVYAEESKHLKDAEMQKGIQSIITLAKDAAQKMDQYSKIFAKHGSATETKEFIELMDFYQKKILKHFEEMVQTEDKWIEEWGGEADPVDIQRRGLKDFETVTRDRDYELFMIAKEDGSQFYTKNLIRHIKLVANIDQLMETVTGDDPLIKIKVVEDRQIHHRALHMKNLLRADFDKWIQKSGKFREDPMIQSFYKAMMALFLASNQRNLLIHSSGKSCIGYFHDFLVFLRETLNNVDYVSLIDNPPPDLSPFYVSTLELIHKMCYELFLYKIDQSQGLSLFTRIISEEETKESKKTQTSLSLWNVILDDYYNLQDSLSKYPSGPLFKVLDLLQNTEEREFDPFLQEDIPTGLYTLFFDSLKVGVLRSPCPIHQKMIQSAEIIPEFTGFIRRLNATNQRVLLINFQDRTSWKDFARCQAIEEYQKKAEIGKALDVVTIPKDTDFYLQSDVYIKSSNITEFKEMLLEQVKSEEGCGFYFPKRFDRNELVQFFQNCIEMVHETFFPGKEQLSRKNRLDFIELFYQFFILKLVMISKSNYLIFSAKDSVDIPSTSSAAFYAIAKLLGGTSNWTEEEKDFLTAMMFLPSLLIRERVVDIRYLNRSVSCLALLSAELEVNKSGVIKNLETLFGFNFNKSLGVSSESA